MRNKDYIDDIIEAIDNRRLVLFVGAGISVDPPSCLPLSNQLKEGILYCILKSTGKYGRKYLKQKGEKLSAKCNKVILEKFMQILYTTINNHALDLLEVFNRKTPNKNHRFVAELIRRNLVTTVFTTNFDQLIEKACSDAKFQINVCINIDDFTLPNISTLIKLHGSIEQMSTIVTTLDKVDSLPPEKIKVLVYFLERSDFLFLGWSNDDLDVSPILMQNGSRKFFWLKHSSKKDFIRVVDWRDIPAESNARIDQLIRRHKGKKIELPTDTIIEDLFTRLNIPTSNINTTGKINPLKVLSKVINKWVKDISIGDRFLILGDILAYIGWFDDAKLFYEKAFRAFQKGNDKPGLFIVNINLGEMYERQGNYEKAKLHFKEAKIISTAAKGKLGMAIILYKEAMLHQREQEHKQALSKYEQCFKISNSLGNVSMEANSLHQSGIIHETLGSIEKAISLYKQSANLRKNIGDIEGWVASQSQLASSFVIMGRYKDANIILEETADILRKIGNSYGIAILYHKQGHLFQTIGKYDEAINFFNKSLVIKKEIGFEEDIADTQHEIAIVLHEKNNLKEAMAVLQDVLRIRRKYHNIKGIGQVLHEIGMVKEDRGDFIGALDNYEESLSHQNEVNYMRGISQTLHQKGVVLMKMGRLDESLKSLQQSLKLTKKLGDKEGEASTYHQMGMVYHEMLRKSVEKADNSTDSEFSGKALSFYEEGLRIRREIGNPMGIAISQGQIGIYYYEITHLRKAVLALREAKEIFAELKSPQEELMVRYLNKIHSEVGES